jgi:hypothetical protein
MSDYVYTIGKAFPYFDTLNEARRYVKHVIKSDRNTAFLNRDNVGRHYIVRTDIYTQTKKTFYL